MSPNPSLVMHRRSIAPRVFVALAAILLPLASLGGALPPALHLELRSSRPAEGDTLAQPPERVRLEFTQAVDPATSEITLVLADGRSIALSPERDPTDDRVLLAVVHDGEVGWHRVNWRVLSADGHAVRGSLAFYVTLPAGRDAGTAIDEAPPAAQQEAARFPAVAALLRGAASAAQLALAGVLFFSVRAGPSDRLGRLARLLVALALVATALHVVAWLGYAGFGDRPGSWLRLLGGVGRLEVARFILVGLAFATLLYARESPMAGLVAATFAVLCGAGIGHAASFSPLLSVPAKALHLGAAAVWLGGLLTLALGERDADTFARNAKRVSAAALWAVIAVAVSGTVQALVIAKPGDLFGSGYGLALAAKILGLGVLVGFGALHRLRLLPKLATTSEGAPLRRAVAWEIGVFALVILLAGLLGYMTPPEAGLATGISQR